MENTNLNSWEGLVNNYLKADNLADEKGEFVVQDVAIVPRQNEAGVTRNQLELTTFLGDTKYLFSVNYTNSKLIMTKVESPKELIGKTLKYEKVNVQNPTTKKMQKGISIVDVI